MLVQSKCYKSKQKPIIKVLWKIIKNLFNSPLLFSDKKRKLKEIKRRIQFKVTGSCEKRCSLWKRKFEIILLPPKS